MRDQKGHRKRSAPALPLVGADESFGLRVKSVRLHLGLSQVEFAKRLGISQAYLSGVERNIDKPNLEIMKGIILSGAHVSAGWLMAGEGPMFLPTDSIGRHPRE